MPFHTQVLFENVILSIPGNEIIIVETGKKCDFKKIWKLLD